MTLNEIPGKSFLLKTHRGHFAHAGKIIFPADSSHSFAEPRINQQQTESISAKRGVGVEFQCVSAWQTVQTWLPGTQAHVPTHKYSRGRKEDPEQRGEEADGRVSE